MIRTTLPFGNRPRMVEFADHIQVTEVPPPAPGSARPIDELLDQALDEPVASGRLEEEVSAGARVVLVVSDGTRDDPRAELVRAVMRRLPADVQLTVAVANGTHRPGAIEALGLPEEVLARASVVNHDARDESCLVSLGETRRGTPVRVHRCLVEADWVIATGRIKPHYFAGFGAGCKAIFPGLGSNREIRINHLLKREPGARPGVVDGNPCRDDLEEAVALVPARTFLLNLVMDAHGGARYAVAGHVRHAFARGARLCDPLFRVRAPRSRLVVVSDALPLTGSLYQASKLVASAAELLLDGGTMVVVAECPDGIGPVDTVNQGIYELGLVPRLPREHRIVLVSALDRKAVAQSYCEWAGSVQAVVEEMGAAASRVTVLPKAGSLIVEAQ